MLLVGMSCVGASQHAQHTAGGGHTTGAGHNPGAGHGLGTGQKELSKEEIKKKYDEIHREIAELNNENLQVKFNSVLQKITPLGTYDFPYRDISGKYKGRSNLYSIHLIQELLEIGFYKPSVFSNDFNAAEAFGSNIKSLFLDECLNAVEVILEQITDQSKQKTEREQFKEYFNGQQFKTNRYSFEVAINENKLVSTQTPKLKQKTKPNGPKSDPSMENLVGHIRAEAGAWGGNTAL